MMLVAAILLQLTPAMPDERLRAAQRAYETCLYDAARTRLAAGASVSAAVRAAEPGCKAAADVLHDAINAQPSDAVASVLPVKLAAFERAKSSARIYVGARLRRQQGKADATAR